MRESVLFVLAREVIGYGRIMRPDTISLCDCDYMCVWWRRMWIRRQSGLVSRLCDRRTVLSSGRHRQTVLRHVFCLRPNKQRLNHR